MFKGSKDLTRDGVVADTYGGKEPRDRVTFTIGISCDGRLLIPQLITKYKNPRPAIHAGIRTKEQWKERFGVHKYHQKKMINR